MSAIPAPPPPLLPKPRIGDDQPVWALTGTDDAGVAAAVRAFAERTLRDRYAVAVDAAGPVALPVQGGAG